METDKDNHLPDDKSLSFSSINENQDVDINPPLPTQAAAASEIAELEANADNPDTEKKDGEEEHQQTDDHDETEQVPDLSKVSVEIDQFISNLSAEQSEPPKIPDFLEQFAFLVEARIANYDSLDTMRWTQLQEEDSNSILEHVDRISKLSTSLSKFSSDSDYASSINRIGGILQRALSYLEEEFRLILEDYKVADPDPDSKTEQSSEADQTVSEPDPQPEVENYFLGYSEGTVSNLNTLVHAIISAGHEPECCQEYFISRRKAMEVSLNELGFEKCSIDDVQKKNWDSLERDIGTWNKTFKEFFNMLLPCERKLAESVFSRYKPISMNLFGMLSRGMMIQLLNFAEAVAMTKRSAEKLFKFLDVYETLRDLFLTMDELFPSDCVDELKTEATLTRSRLGEAMICIFCDLENSIKADTGKTPVAGGAVHPLTRYIMNYLKYACEYKDTLEQVFKEHQKIERADSVDRSDFNAPSNSQSQNESPRQSPFELQLSKVMDLLDMNLDSKSKLYKDTTLSLIFLMNNGRYILQKIKGSAEIKSSLGDTWCRKRSSDLRSYHKSYQRETWGKLLQCLSLDGLIVNGKVVKPVLKEKFKSFNAMFDEIHKTQSTWIVSDEQLQSELRVSISAIVTPAYRSFMARFSSTFTPGRQTEKYIKYQPEDIETYIEELFDGASASAAVGRRR